MAAPRQMTERQEQVLATIRTAVRERGYPPSIREIADAVGLKSSSSVHHQLEQLSKLGYLRRDPSRPRAIEVVIDSDTDLEGARGRAARHLLWLLDSDKALKMISVG